MTAVPFDLAAHQRARIRVLERDNQGLEHTAEPLCPSCGKWAKYLEEHTGFCQSCTNEHRRGSGPKPEHKP